MSNKEFEVTWRTTVTAKGVADAAKQARAAMIDPAHTQATFMVRRLPNGGERIITVDDPDRSNE